MHRRILLLITDLKIGGTPTVVRELAIRLNDPPSARVDVACLSPRGPVADQLEAAGVRVFPLNAKGATDFAAIFRLGHLIRAEQYDTVFSFLIHANAAAAAIAPFCKTARFLQSIQTTQPYPRWHWAAQSIAQHAADRIVVPSPSVAIAAQQWADIPSDKISIVSNAIDLEDFACVPQIAASQFGTSPIPIGFIGRLDPIKRIPDLLYATRILKGRVHLHLFGEGSERPAIEKLIATLGLSKMVTLHGSVAQPQDALRQIAMLVLPSDAEGFGLVLIEAMAAGIPVIGTNAPGIRDVIVQNRTGLLVPARAPDALASAIAKLLNNPVLQDQFIAAATQDIRRRFAWPAVIPQYLSLIHI